MRLCKFTAPSLAAFLPTRHPPGGCYQSAPAYPIRPGAASHGKQWDTKGKQPYQALQGTHQTGQFTSLSLVCSSSPSPPGERARNDELWLEIIGWDPL